MLLYTSTNLINNSSAYKVVEKDGKKIFRMDFGPQFSDANKANVKIFKAPFKAETPDLATITLPNLDPQDSYRLNMYVRSTGNADPMYANNWVFKGKPFIVEFSGKMNATEVKDIANKFMLALYDHKQLEISAPATNKLTFKGINGYQRFFAIILEHWHDDNTPYGGYWEVVKNYKEDIVTGCEGFGTYDQVLKDLRLPVMDNLAYLNANTTQMPVLGGKYTLYTVHMTQELVNYPGGIGINNPVSSITDHVFFVIEDAVEDFETKLADFATDGIKEVPEVTD